MIVLAETLLVVVEQAQSFINLGLVFLELHTQLVSEEGEIPEHLVHNQMV